jgi:hypothetical protein
MSDTLMESLEARFAAGTTATITHTEFRMLKSRLTRRDFVIEEEVDLRQTTEKQLEYVRTQIAAHDAAFASASKLLVARDARILALELELTNKDNDLAAALRQVEEKKVLAERLTDYYQTKSNLNEAKSEVHRQGIVIHDLGVKLAAAKERASALGKSFLENDANWKEECTRLTAELQQVVESKALALRLEDMEIAEQQLALEYRMDIIKNSLSS